MKKLNEKIREIEEVYAEEKQNGILNAHEQARRDEAMRLLGGIRAVDRLQENIFQHISSQLINALILFQKEKMYEHFGFSRFADFLDNSDFSLPSKTAFYRQKELLKAEGVEKYDLFNEAKIPLSTRKLLASGDGGNIEIDGDQIIIGEERSDLSDLPMIKSLITNFANENRQLNEEKTKADKKIEDLQSRVKTGQSEYEEIRRAMDAANNGTPYERALMKAIGAMLNLAVEANKLPLIEIQSRGRDDIALLWNQMLNVRAALQQEDFAFIENVDTNLPESIRKVLSENDDWGDDDEK